jgi:hypothetical protein
MSGRRDSDVHLGILRMNSESIDSPAKVSFMRCVVMR